MTTEDSLQPERIIYSVSELNSTVRGLLESEFPLIWVEGEISNFSQPGSGHMYFTLKDAAAQVSCAMFKNRNMYLRFRPENGQQVLIRARVSLYEARGNFQLIAEHMEEAGDGALQRAFNELKARLAAEGLFDEDLKQPIPELPSRIGVITSPTGAAIRDVLSVLKRRFPAIPVLVYPVPVQGEGAARKIADTITLASKRNDCDVLLLVRGGGSLEDLWSFNEEIVARAIVASEIPIVCGVGHEVDITIADFAADMRAPTPSAAAELISPDQQSYLDTFAWYRQRLEQLISARIERLDEQTHWLRKRLNQQHPLNRIQQQEQRLDELQQRLSMAWFYAYGQYEQRLQNLQGKLFAVSPRQYIEKHKHRLSSLIQRLNLGTRHVLQQKRQHLASLGRTLHAVSPLETLARGYAIALDNKGNSITSHLQVKPEDAIEIKLHDGSILGRVEKTLGK